MEIYVDKIMIKSKQMVDFASDLEKILSSLRRVGLKLNPIKCTYRVKSGKFLGHIFSHMGLNANHEKTSVFADIQSLKNVRDVQVLTRRQQP